jgi:hypothetical protein
MLGLQLRTEFRGVRLRGTTIDFNNAAKTGALDMAAKDFLRITYPSVDLLKTIKAAAPGSDRAVVLIGDKGQGKSHLMAALCHLLKDSVAGENWLRDWSYQFDRPELAQIKLQSSRFVIAEPLHEKRFAYLWNLIFDRHPNGEYARGVWAGQKTEVPGKDIMVDMFTRAPCALLLDEFQTWFDGLSDAQEPRRVWAFNFIQILSEIAENNPELLTLVVSVREGSSDAAQQLFRVNPVRVDFKGEQAQHDRRRLLLYRIFENRNNVGHDQIAALAEPHLTEFMRLGEKPVSELDKHRARFIEAWPFSPELLQLLDDEIIFAIKAQGTRDLVRILVELFKSAGDKTPVITPADFDLAGDDTGSAAALIDNVGIDHHKQLRDRALRNLTAVEEALGGHLDAVPHLREILTSLWLRSLSLDNQRVGADPETLQIDVTRSSKIDDNAFQAELATIESNSYNIHKMGSRLVFKLEENARTRLIAHARNDKQFQNGEDVDFLASEIRHAIGGDAQVSGLYKTVVLKREWRNTPWEEIDESQRQASWDNKIPLIVLPVYPAELNTALGGWLKKNLASNRNTVRFLLPRKSGDGFATIYHDKELMLSARAASLAKAWASSEPVYKALSNEFITALRNKVSDRFDRFAILSIWNHEDSAKCLFSVEPHGAKGDKIPSAIQEKIKQNLFIDEDFDELVVSFAEKNLSMAKLLAELREPRAGAKECIPWLGEPEAKDAVLTVCAAGDIAIHLRGLRTLQLVPGESSEFALKRMKRDFEATGRQLEDTMLAVPGSAPSSSGQGTATPEGNPGQPGLEGIPSGAGGGQPAPGGDAPPLNPFGGQAGGPNPSPGGGAPVVLTTFQSAATSSLNLLSRVADIWGVGPATNVRNVSLKVDKLTGAQLQQLIRNLPDGLAYALNVDKEGA